jgi:hypothetical protein
MSPILAGRFEQQDAADGAVAALVEAGFDPAQTATFYVNPRGQHNLTPIGGDTDDSRAAHQAPQGSGAGAAIGGVIGAVLGAASLPVAGAPAAVAGAAVAAGVGAYAGSLIGTLNKLGESVPANQSDAPEKAAEEEAPPRHAGMLVAVIVPTGETQDLAYDVFSARGAVDIEENEGEILGGNWVDFDPNKPLRLLRRAATTGAAG